MEPHWEGVTKVCINGPGHMTKMAALRIYGKIFRIFFSGTSGPISTKLGMWHLYLQPIIVCTNETHWLTLTYFTPRSNSATQAFLWENVKTGDFSESIAACGLTVCTCRQLIEIMKVVEY